MSGVPNPSRKSSSPLLLIGLGCGALALLSVCCGGIGVFAFLRFKSGIQAPGPLGTLTAPDESRQATFTPTPLGPELKYLPDQIRSLESIRVDQMVESSVHAELRKQRADKVKERDTTTMRLLGDVVPMSEVARLTAVDVAPWYHGGGYAIITTRGPVNRVHLEGKLLGLGYSKKQKVGDTALLLKGEAAFCLPTDNLILRGGRSEIEPILKRNGKPRFDTAFQKVFDAADFSKTQVEIVGSGVNPTGGGPWVSFNPAMVEGKEDLDDFVIHQVGWGKGVWSQTIVFPRKMNESRRKIDEQLSKQREPDYFPEMKQAYASVKVAEADGRLVVTGAIPPEHVPMFIEKRKIE